MRWIALWMVGCALGCAADDGGVGSGTDGASTGADGASTNPTGGEASASGNASADSGGPSIDCGNVDASGACEAALEGMSCAFGDDCGGYTLRCEDGVWVQTGASGCNAPIVTCREGPQEGDGCPHFSLEVCDPEDDCIDVLVCDQFNWRAVEECPKTLCEMAQPVVAGEPCPLEPYWLACPGDPPCEATTYSCPRAEWTPLQADHPPECGLASPFVGEYVGTVAYLECNAGATAPLTISVDADGAVAMVAMGVAIPNIDGGVDDDGTFEGSGSYADGTTCTFTGTFSGAFVQSEATGDWSCEHVPVVGDPFTCFGTWMATER